MRERRVLAKLVSRHAGTRVGVFELGDGRQVEVEGTSGFETPDAPEAGERALIVVDDSGRALRWEPYPGTRLRRGLD